MEIDRRLFIASLGGAAAVAAMDHEARAEAIEDYMSEQLDAADASADDAKPKFPTVAEIEAQIETRGYRRGAGAVFVAGRGNVAKVQPMPAKPTLLDYFNMRFTAVNHVLQSANRAMKTGMTEEIIFACLLHDVSQTLIKVDHGWFGAQLFEPYVSEKVTFAIRYHQALRFFPDPTSRLRISGSVQAHLRRGLRTASAYPGGVQIRAKPQVVHGASAGDGKRSVCVRSERQGLDGSVHRHHRAAVQAA